MVSGDLAEDAVGVVELVAPLGDVSAGDAGVEGLGFFWSGFEAEFFRDEFGEVFWGVLFGLAPCEEDGFVGGGHAGDAFEDVVGLGVAGAGAVEAGVCVAVIAGDDDEDVVALGGEFEDLCEGVVKGELVPEEAADVVCVGAVIDAGSFDLEEEFLVVAEEVVEGGGGHFREGGGFFYEFGGVEAVDLEGDVVVAKEAEEAGAF